MAILLCHPRLQHLGGARQAIAALTHADVQHQLLHPDLTHGVPRQLSFFVEFLDGISEGFLKWIFMDEVFTRKTALGLAMKFMNQSSRPKLNRPGAFKAGESLVNLKMGSRLCPQIFSEVGFQLEQLRIKLVIKKA